MKHRLKTSTVYVFLSCCLLSCATVGLAIRSHTKKHRLPKLAVNLSQETPLIPIRSWRICGPFVTGDKEYTAISEAHALSTNYMQNSSTSEREMDCPRRPTSRFINFDRDTSLEADASSDDHAMFLNQTQDFPSADVNSQLMFWGAYHVFKVIYAASDLESFEDQDVALLAPTNSPIKIWLNDQVVAESAPGSVGADWYSHVGARIHLRHGTNHLLIKTLLFPKRNDFSIWLGTPQGVEHFLKEHGGLTEASTELIVEQGDLLHLNPIIPVFGKHEQAIDYVIRDLRGTIAQIGTIDQAKPAVIPLRLPSEGMYSVAISREGMKASEIIFKGDIRKRIAYYKAMCEEHRVAAIPCDALPALLKESSSDQIAFRMDKQKILVFLLSQFEFASDHLSIDMRLTDGPSISRLVAYRSSDDGSLQHYYLHLPQKTDKNSRIPLVIVQPYNTSHQPFFENSPTNPGALAKYAAFADEANVAFVALFTRNRQLPDVSAERDTIDALRHVESLINVDSQRIYLAGECAGGRSALLMAEDHPEIFAGVSTIGAATGDETEPSEPTENSGNVLLRLSNLSNTPISLVHAERDFHSPTVQVRILTQRARASGFSPNLTLLSGNGTFGSVEPVHIMFDFFRQLRNRPLHSPQKISMTITEKLHEDVFWLHAEAPIVSEKVGTASGEIAADGRLTLTGHGISAIAVDGNSLPESFRNRNFDVSYNGRVVKHWSPRKIRRLHLHVVPSN